jgi:hypothetical protein
MSEINDGSVQHGSRDLTIGAEVYATDDFTYTAATGATIERTDKLMLPSGAAFLAAQIAGSFTAQFANASQPDIARGDKFTTDIDGEDKLCYVTSKTKSEAKGQEKKQSCEFRVAINPGDVVVS